VISALTKASRALDATPVVLTFDPHPAAVLRGSAPAVLCDLNERLELLERSGVEIAVVQRFDESFAEQPPEEFLRRAADGRTLAALVMTTESAFGRDRSGGLPAIRRLADEFGYQVIEVPRAARAGATLSSTRLRGLVTAGRLSEVRRELGRPYAVVGTVVAGDRRGRQLGYPTANMAFEAAVALPPDGVYAVRAGWGGAGPLSPARRADGVASLGVRPTFGIGGARILEVHLFEIDEDLYGVRLRVEFVRRLRGEKRFATAQALVKQMDHDSERARTVLDAAGR
jgi:riboflavin kinase/FMN adenylyltransferase